MVFFFVFRVTNMIHVGGHYDLDDLALGTFFFFLLFSRSEQKMCVVNVRCLSVAPPPRFPVSGLGDVRSVPMNKRGRHALTRRTILRADR